MCLYPTHLSLAGCNTLYEVTRDELILASQRIGSMSSDRDFFFTNLMAHGATYGTWGETEFDMSDSITLNPDEIFDYDFAIQLGLISYRYRSIFIDTCSSGGFIQELAEPSSSEAKSVICTAVAFQGTSRDVDDDDDGYGTGVDENEDGLITVGGSEHQEFSYHWMSALRYYIPARDLTSADIEREGSDTNNVISIWEAFKYQLDHNSDYISALNSGDAGLIQRQTPQIDDDGDGVSAQGWSGNDPTLFDFDGTLLPGVSTPPPPINIPGPTDTPHTSPPECDPDDGHTIADIVFI